MSKKHEKSINLTASWAETEAFEFGEVVVGVRQVERLAEPNKSGMPILQTCGR